MAVGSFVNLIAFTGEENLYDFPDFRIVIDD